MKEYKDARAFRQSFWKEYTFAVDGGRKMQMTRVYQGVTPRGGHDFYEMIDKPHFAAFIFDKPIKQDMAERELLELATANMFTILSASPLNKDGTLNPFIAKVQIDLYTRLDERVQGGIIKQISQKTENKTVTTNVNVSATPIQAIQMEELRKREDLTARLMELREQTKDFETSSRVVEEDDGSKRDS